MCVRVREKEGERAAERKKEREREKESGRERERERWRISSARRDRYPTGVFILRYKQYTLLAYNAIKISKKMVFEQCHAS